MSSSILNAHLTNNNYSFGIKINDNIGFQLSSNLSNNRELAIINTCNISNQLKIKITNSNISLRSSNDIPIIFNDFIWINSNNLGINTNNPLNKLIIFKISVF